MKEKDKCLPWYYPQVDPDARLCSPFEASVLRTIIDTMSNNKCKVCKYQLCFQILSIFIQFLSKKTHSVSTNYYDM